MLYYITSATSLQEDIVLKIAHLQITYGLHVIFNETKSCLLSESSLVPEFADGDPTLEVSNTNHSYLSTYESITETPVDFSIQFSSDL